MLRLHSMPQASCPASHATCSSEYCCGITCSVHSLSTDFRLTDTGGKAWLNAVQTFEETKQSLYMYQLHLVCNTRGSLMVCANVRLQSAREMLDFRLDMAMKKGEPTDLAPWAKLVDSAANIRLLTDKAMRHWQANYDPSKGRLQQQLPSSSPQAASSSLPMALAAAPASSPPSVHQPTKGALPAAGGTSSLPHQASTASPSPADIHPGRGSSLHSSPEEDERQVGVALGNLGLPLMHAWVGTSTPPDVRFTPHNLAATTSPFVKEDPNLIIWNPDQRLAAWIDPNLHFNRHCLLQMAEIYSKAQVLIEIDSDDNLKPAAASSVQHSSLGSLDRSNLEAFALAGIIDILTMVISRDVKNQLRDMPQQDPPQEDLDAAIGFWSRRLVYCRHLDQDCLLGCVQIHWWPAQQEVLSLYALLASYTPRLRAGGGPVTQGLGPSQPDVELAITTGGPVGPDQPLATQPPQQRPVAIPNTGHLPPGALVQMDDQIYKKEGEWFVLTNIRTLDSNFTPEQKQMLSKGAAEQADTKHMVQNEAKQAPGPTKSPVPNITARIVPKEEEAELMKTLVGKPVPLKLRYDSSLQEAGKKWDDDLLEQEKRDERNRRAWAKIGKEPPSPKASKSGSKADRLDSLPANAPKNLAAANSSRRIKRPLFTYSSARSTPTQPASGRSGSSKATTQPAAAPAPHATGGLPSEASNGKIQECQRRPSQAPGVHAQAGSGSEEDEDEVVSYDSDAEYAAQPQEPCVREEDPLQAGAHAAEADRLKAEHAAASDKRFRELLQADRAETLRKEQAEAEALANADALLR